MPQPDVSCRDYRPDTAIGGDDRPMCVCGWAYTAHHATENVTVEAYLAHLETLLGPGEPTMDVTIWLPDDAAAAADLTRKYDREDD